MATPKNDDSPPTSPAAWTGSEASHDSDALKPTDTSHTPALQQNFSLWSLLGIGFSLTNSWFGISTALVTGINSGGPVLLIYGIPFIALISTCVGISLSELASAMPNAGGQYFWASELAPVGWKRVAGYTTGWCAWAGSVFTSASVAAGLGSAVVGCVQMLNPDLAVHLADEVPSPSTTIPTAILSTILIGLLTSWPYSLAMFFSLSSLPAIIHTPTKVPILELFRQALRCPKGAVALEALVILTGVGCLVASQAWQSRLCWSFARDGGLPFSSHLSQIHPALKTPFNAHVASSILVAILGLLYLGSEVAFNSMVTACIVLLYVSYSIPIACLLLKGRNHVVQGPFWMGWVGEVANWVVLGWTAL
ncbi:Choline transport protein, partial [Lachnellula suecica]